MVNAELLIKNTGARGYMLSPELAKTLGLKCSFNIRIRYDNEAKIIHLGPFIGVFTCSLPNKEEFAYTGLQAELIALSNLSKKLAAEVFIFTPFSINWSTKTVRGYTYRSGSWSSSFYPIPDVVYDRIPSRKSEARSSTQTAKKRLKRMPYLQYFNPSFLNKWKVHQLLTPNEQLKYYLPETRFLNISNLEEMLDSYRLLYLKPSNGSLGQGIIKVNKGKLGKLTFTIYRNGQRMGTAGSAQELMRKTRAARRGKAYIVQQGLDLATQNGSPFDIRILFQKNRQGEWQIAKKFVRIAPAGSSVANLSRGGKVAKSDKVLASVLSRNQTLREDKNQEIRELCQLVADSLEINSNNLFGELGLDVGIDKQGKLWLIEVNSKPRKTAYNYSSRAIIRNSFKRPLEYSIFLAGF